MKKFLLLLALAIAVPSVVLEAAPNPFANAAVTNSAVLVKAAPSGGTVFLLIYNAANTNSSTAYVQFFDAATAGAVTPGTTAPLFFLAIPASGVLDGSMIQGIPFANGIVITVTTTPTGGTAPTTAVPVTLCYQ